MPEVKELSLSDRQGELLDNGSWMAKKLKKIIEDGDLAIDCGGKKKHVVLEAWTTVARLQMECPHAKLVKVYKDEAGHEVVEAYGWVTDAAEKIVSEASAVVSEREKNWKGKHLSARVSMAQTRALSKALRLRHSWIMVMAGYEATPAEEMEPVNAIKEPLVVVDAEAQVKEPAKEEPKEEPPKKAPEKKGEKILTWKGKLEKLEILKLPNGSSAWSIHAAGQEFKTTVEAHSLQARTLLNRDEEGAIEYWVNAKGTNVIDTIEVASG